MTIIGINWINYNTHACGHHYTYIGSDTSRVTRLYSGTMLTCNFYFYFLDLAFKISNDIMLWLVVNRVYMKALNKICVIQN